MKYFRLLALMAAVAGLSASPLRAQKVQINGAGASFPYPIYSKWFSEYNKLHPEIEINYQSIGSGGGIRQLTSETVFFGASDGPMNEEQLKAAPGKVLHFPTVLGGVVPVYNLPGVGELKFSGPVIADMVLGKITKWNDPALTKLNPSAKLPATDIVIAHRSDGSGTTYIFVDYLSKVSPEFKEKVGVNTSVNWPTGVGGKGNEGVAGLVKQTPGAFGYVELIYAIQNKIEYGSVQNQAGEFVRSSLESVTAAASAAASNMPADFRVSITNAPGANAYPISSFTYLLVPVEGNNPANRKVLKDMLSWILKSGEGEVAALSYAPLPESVQTKVLNTVYGLK